MSFAIELIRSNSPTSLLDIGCGDGRLIHMIKPLIPRLIGVDLSDRAVDFARAFNPDVEFVCDDIATISEEFAWVTLIEVLEHIPDDQLTTFVENVARIVQADGHLLISVPTVNVSLNRKHYRHYNLALLKDTIEPHFEIESYWWLYHHGLVERLLRFLICNRLYVLNSKFLLAQFWKVHKVFTYHADSSTGNHLLCLARPISK